MAGQKPRQATLRQEIFLFCGTLCCRVGRWEVSSNGRCSAAITGLPEVWHIRCWWPGPGSSQVAQLLEQIAPVVRFTAPDSADRLVERHLPAFADQELWEFSPVTVVTAAELMILEIIAQILASYTRSFLKFAEMEAFFPIEILGQVGDTHCQHICDL
jgi:hypothetical protein